jgi:ATP-dependent DNA helicase RecG
MCLLSKTGYTDYSPVISIDIQTTAVATSHVSLGVTQEVTREVIHLLHAMQGDILRKELQAPMTLKDNEHFRKAYLTRGDAC